MPQFTPPQVSPLVMQLANDRLRQQQWERTQNARIQQEQRSDEYKQTAEMRKEVAKLNIKIAEGGGNTNAMAGASSLFEALLLGSQELSRISQPGLQEKQQNVLEPLATPLAGIMREVSGLQNLALSREDESLAPGEQARLRTLSRQAAAPTAQIPGPRVTGFGPGGKAVVSQGQGFGTLVGRLAAAGGEEQRQAEIAAERITRRQAEAPVMTTRELNKEVRRTRAAAQKALNQFGMDSPEYQEAIEGLMTSKAKRDSYVAGGGMELTVGPEGTSFSSGATGKIRQDLRARKQIGLLDAAVWDVENTLNILLKDPSIAGTVGGAKRLLSRLEDISVDIMLSDILPEMGVVDPADVDRIRSKVMGPDLSGLSGEALARAEAEVMQYRVAYLWVRAQRGNGRITNEQLNDAKALFQIIGGLRSSTEVINRWRVLLSHMKRDARNERGNYRDVTGLTIPNKGFRTPVKIELAPQGAEQPGAAPPVQIDPADQKIIDETIQQMLGGEAGP